MSALDDVNEYTRRTRAKRKAVKDIQRSVTPAKCSAADAFDALQKDFGMLLNGSWAPDDDSVNCSLETLAVIQKSHATLLASLKECASCLSMPRDQNEGKRARRAIRLAEEGY